MKKTYFFAKKSTKCYNFVINLFIKSPLIPEQSVVMSELQSKRDGFLFFDNQFSLNQ